MSVFDPSSFILHPSSLLEVAEGVTAISLDWSNAYLLQADGSAALIDTGLRRDRERLVAALGQAGVRPEHLRSVYLTHAHCDHAGNAAFLAAQGAQIHVHRSEAPFLGQPLRTYALSGPHMLLRPLTVLSFLIGELVYPVERRRADVLHEDGDLIDAPGGPLRLIASPGHTPGHAAYYRERDGLLFSGDAILNIVPFKRVTGLSLPIRMLSDNWVQAKQSAQRLAQLRPARLLAGHGWPLTEDAAARIQSWAEKLL